MKKIQIFKLEDEIPSNARFIHIEHSAIRGSNKVVTKLYYEIPIIEERDKIVDKHKETIKEVIEHLNKMTGGKYTVKAKATVTLIRARLNEGRTLEDFKHVIDTKTLDWFSDHNMRQFLRPQTLFGNKFDGYLSTKTGSQIAEDNFSELDSIIDSIGKPLNYDEE